MHAVGKAKFEFDLKRAVRSGNCPIPCSWLVFPSPVPCCEPVSQPSYGATDRRYAYANISRQVLGSSLVESSSQVDVLADFLNVPPQKLKLTLLFSTAVSGWNPYEFHGSCDQKGATITLIRCRRHYYGGFASVSWTPQTQWLHDPKAFLFRFKYDSTQKHVTAEGKFDSNGTGNNLLSRPNYGPIFGYKHYLRGGSDTSIGCSRRLHCFLQRYLSILRSQ